MSLHNGTITLIFIHRRPLDINHLQSILPATVAEDLVSLKNSKIKKARDVDLHQRTFNHWPFYPNISNRLPRCLAENGSKHPLVPTSTTINMSNPQLQLMQYSSAQTRHGKFRCLLLAIADRSVPKERSNVDFVADFCLGKIFFFVRRYRQIHSQDRGSDIRT